MPALLAVLSRSDAFSGVWEELASEAGMEGLRTGRSAPELAPLGEFAALVLAVGGVEEEAPSLLRELEAHPARPPVVVVGAQADHRLATATVRSGAADYLALPQDLPALLAWLEERADEGRARERAAGLAAREAERYDFSSLVGESEGLRAALRRAARIIPRGDATVLLTGETGTGKELLAQAIHYNGPRGEGPFVDVNCTALPSNLLEAELFGYEKGAFTDARTAKPGLFEAAHGGTLLLDEVGDLAAETQAKLLKVLEDKRVRRLGSLKAVQVDVRVMAATHVDLATAVQEGRFREDLFYRLHVLPIHLPPLRERGDDVLLLAEHFLERAVDELELPPLDLTPPLKAALRAHAWPGNVRELRNAVERAVLLGDGGLREEDLFLEHAPRSASSGLPFPASLREIERAAATLALRRTEGNKSAAAELLGISRTRLYRLLDEAESES